MNTTVSYRTVNHQIEAPRVPNELSKGFIRVAKQPPSELPEFYWAASFSMCISFLWTEKLIYLKLKDELSRSIALLLVAETLMDRGL